MIAAVGEDVGRKDAAIVLAPAALAGDQHAHRATMQQLAEQQLVGQRTLDLVLQQARHRPRAHVRIEAVLGQPLARFRRCRQRDGQAEF